MKHRWAARAVVIGLHLGLLAGLWFYKPPGLPAHKDRRLTTLRLITPVTRVPPPAQAVAPARAALLRPSAPAPVPVSPVPDPIAPGDTAAPPVAAPAAVDAPAPPPMRSTLRLTLPPGYAASAAAARNPALTDPRSNTPRLTLEDRIADATGGAGAWVEERTSENRSQSVGALGDRRTVMRRGDTCVELFRSRIADSDPFNGNVAPRTMAMQGRAYKCK